MDVASNWLKLSLYKYHTVFITCTTIFLEHICLRFRKGKMYLLYLVMISLTKTYVKGENKPLHFPWRVTPKGHWSK